MIRTLRVAGLGIVLFAILLTFLPISAWGIEISLGNMREHWTEWLMETRHLSRDSAEQAMRYYERQQRVDVIDSFDLPDKFIADFVNVDAAGPGPVKVEKQGCALFMSPYSKEGREFQEAIRRKGPRAEAYFRAQMREAYERGYFAWKLTPQQERQLDEALRPGARPDRPAAATPIRVLVVGCTSPGWPDQNPAPGRISHDHPINLGPGNAAEDGRTPGGRWNLGQRVGLSTWSQNHAEVLGQTYVTNTEFRERWFNFMFNTSNPNSIANYYRQNSHGRISISGDRSDIVGWLETHHILDANDVGSSHNYTVMPGTPLVRTIGATEPYIFRASLRADGDFSVLFRDTFVTGRTTRGNYTFWLVGGTAPDSPPYRIKPGTGNPVQDPEDSRHVTFPDITFQYWDSAASTPQWRDKSDPSSGQGWAVRFDNGDPGMPVYWYAGWSVVGGVPGPTEGPVFTQDASSRRIAEEVAQGCAPLPNTTVVSSDLLASNQWNRLLSFCYYTHNHAGPMTSSRPYQLAHARNSNGSIDDIQGDQDVLAERAFRPYPYDHDLYDHDNNPTGGVLGTSGSHTCGQWKSDVKQVLNDNGVTWAGYDRYVFTWPSPVPAGAGGIGFTANASGPEIAVPSTVGLATCAHELGHTFGFPDLYDTDFYYNGGGGTPPHFESVAMGPYSVMGAGVRVDAYCKLVATENGPWFQPNILAVSTPTWKPQDQVAAPIPEIEGTLQNPVVYAAVPDYATQISTGPGPLTGLRQEFFLVENRNRRGGQYFGDASPAGMYIYHVDRRFGQDDDANFMVIIEQADGLYELEHTPAGTGTQTESDPFPGSLGVRSFTQWTNPNSRAHGLLGSGGLIEPGTSYDSFFRVGNISDPGVTMRADLFVQPRELVVTATSQADLTALQGEPNVEILSLHLNNDATAPNISQGDVVLREVLIDESGNSNDDNDVARALLYEDVGNNGDIDPGTDVLLATAPVVGQQARFTGLSFRVILGTTRHLLIGYDIADNAQTVPQVTLGAGIDYADPNYDPAFPRSSIRCQIPGAVQERVRTGIGTWGDARFPVRSDDDKVVILEAPDTLTVTPTDVAPATAIQGTPDVAMLGLRLHVDRDTVELQSLRVDQDGTSTRPGDIAAKLYDDANINGVLDPAEPLVDTADFSQPGGPGTPIYAVLDDLHGYQIDDTADRGLLIVYDFASDATVGDTVDATMLNNTYVQLVEPDDLVATTNFPMDSSDTLIVINSPPTLTDTSSPPGTTAWLSPTTGTPTTTFIWDAIYTDTENEPPSPIQVCIDGTPHDMWPVNAVDTNYTDGALFRYQTNLAVGTHTYYMFASDGSGDVRFPPVAPNTYSAPLVVNTPPVLSNGRVTPPRGDDTQAFLYEITYTDPDAHVAAYVNVMIDGGGALPMTWQATNDGDPTNGEIYELNLTPGTLSPGAHKAKFEANDGFDTVYWPSVGEMSGPIVMSDSSGFFADASYAVLSGPYEEGNPIYAQITDIDQNLNVNAIDVLQVDVSVAVGSDSETVTLIETAVDSGIFRTPTAGFPTLGRSGAPDDGAINVIAGPTGNVLLLDYVDPFDPSDTQSLMASVVDTVAPAIVKATELLLSSDTNGTTVSVDFTAYDEAAQIDVARYNVYYETAPAPIGTLTPRAQLTAGTQSVQIPTGGPGPDMYVAVAVYDEVPNVRTNVKWKLVHTNDREPPVLVGPNPSDGQTGVPLDTTITFRLDDIGSGIAVSDITVRIKQDPADGGTWTNITSDPGLDIQGTANSRVVTYDPAADFLYNQTVTVRVNCKDKAANSMTDSFSFSTVTDFDPPDIQNISPADGETNVPVDSSISFDLLDSPAGIDLASLRVTVDGTNVSGLLQTSGTPDALSVLYEPATDFGYGDDISVTVDASDVAGNAMSTVIFTFTTIPDNAGTVIDQLSPPAGATDVMVDTAISFRVQDAVSGVNKNSVRLTVMGSAVTLTDANFSQLSTTSYLVTYDPPGDLPIDTLVIVQASARDNAGNPRTSIQWRFRTEPPPTYSITGTIVEMVPDEGVTQTTPVGVAGVAVQISEVATGNPVQTVYTAGTGVYRVAGLLDGSYEVEPTLTDYTFLSAKNSKPTQRVYVGMRDTDRDGNPQLDASGVDFSATHTLYAIKGRVSEGGVGLAGVQITDGTRTATTDPEGRYSIDEVPSGVYTVTPSLTNYTFNPASRAAVVASANATGIDFTASARTFSVSGTISDSVGTRLAGVEVRVMGSAGVAVTSRAGQYTLAGVKSGLQTIVATRDGYTFEAAPGVTTDNVLVDADLAGVDFVGYPVLSRTFAAGIHFIGVPARPRSTDAETVFGTRDVARWSPTSAPARYFTTQLEPDAPILRVEPGAGFFVRLAQQTDLDVPGTPVPMTTPFGFVINQGWNMASNPFPTALAFGNLKPNDPNGMAPYGFVRESGDYLLVSNVSELRGRRWIDGWEGVWLLGNAAGVTITALPPGSPAASATEPAKRTVDRNNWQIPIVARATGSVDSCNAVGVSAETGGITIPNPPPVPDGIDVVVQGEGGEGLAYDLRSSIGNGAAWTFGVVTGMANADVQVSLPDLSEVPPDLTVTLVDVAAGREMYARTMSTYLYNSGQGGAREFTLKVEPRKTAGLAISPAGIQLGAHGATVSYVLTASADVRARVMNMAGRPVKVLAGGKTTPAGVNTLMWDLSSDSKTRVPNGMYLVEIEAVAPDGQSASALQTIRVYR